MSFVLNCFDVSVDVKRTYLHGLKMFKIVSQPCRTQWRLKLLRVLKSAFHGNSRSHTLNGFLGISERVDLKGIYSIKGRSVLIKLKEQIFLCFTLQLFYSHLLGNQNIQSHMLIDYWISMDLKLTFGNACLVFNFAQ